MKIKESKNLTYDKKVKLTYTFEDDQVIEIRNCILESFNRLDDRFELNFKNRSRANIAAKNIEGSKEIDLIAEKLESLIGTSYEEIIEFDF